MQRSFVCYCVLVLFGEMLTVGTSAIAGETKFNLLSMTVVLASEPNLLQQTRRLQVADKVNLLVINKHSRGFNFDEDFKPQK